MSILLHVSLSGGVLILLAILLRWLGKKRLSPVFFRTLWLLITVRLLCLFPLPSPFGHLNTETLLPSTSPSAHLPLPGILPPGGTMAEAADIPLFLLLWGAGVVTVWSVILFRHLHWMRQVRRHTLSTHTVGRLQLVVSPYVDGPCTAGWIRPRIYLPIAPSEYDADILACILAHEGAHIRHRDGMVRLLATAALGLHWFNGTVWILLRLFHQDMERVCDTDALRLLGENHRHTYATALLDLAEARGAVLSFGGRSMKERIYTIMKQKPYSLLTAVLAAALCLGCAAVFAASPADSLYEVDTTPTPQPVVAVEPSTEETPVEPISPEPESESEAETWLFPIPEGTAWTYTTPYGTVSIYIPDIEAYPKAETSDSKKVHILTPQEKPQPGTKMDVLHDGADIAAPEDTPLLAALSGTVVKAEYHYEYGAYLIIDAGNGIQYQYRHCEKLLVKVGDTVERGQEIAVIGRTGNATGVHVHFTVTITGMSLDPMTLYH